MLTLHLVVHLKDALFNLLLDEILMKLIERDILCDSWNNISQIIDKNTYLIIFKHLLYFLVKFFYLRLILELDILHDSQYVIPPFNVNSLLVNHLEVFIRPTQNQIETLCRQLVAINVTNSIYTI